MPFRRTSQYRMRLDDMHPDDMMVRDGQSGYWSSSVRPTKYGYGNMGEVPSFDGNVDRYAADRYAVDRFGWVAFRLKFHSNFRITYFLFLSLNVQTVVPIKCAVMTCSVIFMIESTDIVLIKIHQTCTCTRGTSGNFLIYL